MKKILVNIIFIFVAVITVLGQGKSNSKIELIEFQSKVFNNTRTLRVLLPIGYQDQRNLKRRYPVFYFNDGYAFFEYWKAQETIDQLIREGSIEPMIVVGIDNAGEEARADEYLPYPDESLEPPLPHPHGKLYPQFLIDEVMPFINQKFRTKTGSANTGLGGASYGSYISIYTATVRQGVIGKLLLESTPLFINDFQIIKDAQASNNLPEYVYIGVGKEETPNEEINKMIGVNAKKLETAILTGSPKTKTKVVLGEKDSHNSEAWRRRLPFALKFLCGIKKSH